MILANVSENCVKSNPITAIKRREKRSGYCSTFAGFDEHIVCDVAVWWEEKWSGPY